MHPQSEIFIGTVCLERNRWGSRIPSFRVSDWLARFRADGFDGIELWENHYASADVAERQQLAASACVTVFNTYVAFDDTTAEARERAAEAIAQLEAPAVKYNVGASPERLPEYRRNLLAWADRLPPSCRLLCECHPGTVLETVSAAAAFFADLDPARFGVIVHIAGDADKLDPWLETFPERAAHIHTQLRDAATDPAGPASRERLDACFARLRSHGYRGSVTIEFTRGIGREEQIEALYANAVADLAYCRSQMTDFSSLPSLNVVNPPLAGS